MASELPPVSGVSPSRLSDSSRLAASEQAFRWPVPGFSFLALVALSTLATGCGGSKLEPKEPTAAVAAPLAPPACGDPTLESDAGTRYYYVAPDGNDAASGSCQQPMATLSAVEKKIRDAEGVKLKEGFPSKLVDNAYTVFVHGGTYLRQTVEWRVAAADPNKAVKILAYPGERPIFDGEGKESRGFAFLVGHGVLTNFQISGFTWRRYKNVLSVGGRQGPGNTLLWTGGAVISDNVFEENGDVYDDGLCKEARKHSNRCFSASIIGLRVAGYNTIERNVFLRAESRDTRDTFGGGSRAVMHALYISEFSNSNIVRDNYMALISGDPFRLRWGSSQNQIYHNYVTDSGQTSFVSCWFAGEKGGAGAPCSQNLVRDNVFTFGYPLTDSRASRCTHPLPEIRASDRNRVLDTAGVIVNEGNIVYWGERPRSEVVSAMTTGDLDGDGRDEVIVALNYDSQFTKIVATDGRSPYLSRIIHAAPTSVSGQVVGLATGRFEGSTRDELIVAFQRPNPSTRVEVWRGNGALLTKGASGAQNIGEVFSTEGSFVDAIAVGDFEEEEPDQLLVAMREAKNGKTSIFLGNGTEQGSEIFGPERQWVRAMAAADLDGDGKDELFTALARQLDASGSSQVTIYRSDGVDSVKGELLFNVRDAMAMALTASPGGKEPHSVFASLDYRAPAAPDEIRALRAGGAPGFSEVVESAPVGSVFTELALPNSTGGKLVRVMVGPGQNLITDGEAQYHRWDVPRGKIKCARQ